MKCWVILWEDAWIRAEGSLKLSSGYDISFHNNLSQTVSPQLCVHSVFAHSKPTLQRWLMAVTTLLPPTAAVCATRHQCRQAHTAIALCPCVCKWKQPNLVIAQSAGISSTLVVKPGNPGQRNLPILLTQSKHFMKFNKILLNVSHWFSAQSVSYFLAVVLVRVQDTVPWRTQIPVQYEKSVKIIWVLGSEYSNVSCWIFGTCLPFIVGCTAPLSFGIMCQIINPSRISGSYHTIHLFSLNKH